MRQAAVCPDLMQYQQLAADKLADADEEAMLQHLERCEACARKVSTLVERDRLVEFIRRYQARGDGAADEGMGRLIERMSKLRPGETQSAAAQTTSSAHNTVPVAALIIACPACGKDLKVKGEFAGKLVKCPHCQQAVCAAAKSAGAPASGVSAVALSVPPRPGTVVGAGHRTGANAAGKLENTVDHQPASGLDKELYSFLAPPQAADELGRLGPYRVLQVLGAGGMGVVFRAEDPQLMRLVALKAMLPALAASASARQRFLREARAAAAIKHDHIVTIYQVGEDRGVPFLAMDFLEGEALDVRLQRAGKLPVAEVLRIGREIALGLAAAHQRGLIHRDIKPANIWLETLAAPGAPATGGRVKILDFGLARAVGAEAQLTQLGAIVGTPAYMAPEQAQGKTVDHRCDLFSLGCVLYRMATGEPAFRGTDVISTLMAIATEHPRPPHELEATLRPALSELIMGLLAKEPEDRPPSAQAVAETLEGIAAVGAASRAAPMLSAARLGSPGLPAAPQPRKKWPIVVGLAACLLLGLAGLWAAGVFKLKTKDGTIVLENLPADAEVFVDGEKVALKLPGNGQPIEIEVAPGTRKLKINAAGFKMETQEVTLAAGERKPIGIRLEPLAVAAEKTALPPMYKNSLGMEFVLVPKGEFLMGGGAGTVGAKEESITKDFYLGKYEVTQGEWQTVTGVNPSYFSREGGGRNEVVNVRNEELQRFPVEWVSWQEARLFVQELNKREKEAGWLYRLPKEAEWEYACRGGATSNKFDYAFDFYFDKPANELLPDQANTDHGKGLKRTCKVGSYRPNRLGLYDMHGNVAEWCDDVLKVAVPSRVSRGGDWEHRAWCRTAWRRLDRPVYRCQHIGLRVARVPIETANPTPPSANAESSPTIVPPPPSAALEAMRRDQIAPEALKLAGGGDANKAPASLVGVLGEAQPIHSQEVWSLAYSPDGRWLASGSADRTIMLRDTATGRVKRILTGHTAPVAAVGFSKDGRTLVSASHDGTLRLWSVDKDEKPTIVEAKLGQPVILAMAVSPDGRFVAAAGNSGLIKLWKWGAWEKPIEIADLRGKVTIRALALSPDGELLACGGAEEKEEARVRIYATADGTEKKNLPNDTTRVTGLSFSHDGKYLAAVRLAALKLPGGDGRVWEVATGKTVAKLTRPTFSGEWNDSGCVAWSPDDKTLAVGTLWRVIVYDFPTGARRTLWFGLDQGMRGLSFSPHGDMLAAGGSNADMPVWDTASWKLKYLERGHTRHMRSVAISPNGQELLSLGNEMAVLRWQLARPEKAVVHHLDFGSDIQPYLYSISYSHDGKTYVTPGSQLIALRNTVTEKENVIRTLPLGLDPPAVSSDGRIVAAGARDGHLHLWDLALGRDVHRFPAKGRWCGLAFSRDGVFLASCNEQTKRMMIWNAATGAEGCSWEVNSPVRTSAFHPHGKTLATGHEDGSILLWDTATGKKIQTLAGHAGPVGSLQFTPDGKTLVSSGHDGIIRLWNPEQPRAREIIPLGPANRPLTFDLDPSGKYLFAAGHSPVIFVLRLPN